MLKNNLITYNKYSDSIFTIHNRKRWMDFFRRRAQENHRIYLANKTIINSIKEYFNQEPSKIPAEAYHTLDSCIHDHIYTGNIDPFLNIELLRILERYNKTAPDSLNFSNLTNVWMAICEANIANLGKDSAATHKSYEYMKRNLDERNKNYPNYTRGLIYSLWNLSKTFYMARHIQDVEENRLMHKRLIHLADSGDVGKYLTAEEKASLTASIKTYQEKLIRNAYLVDSTVMNRQEAFDIMNAIIKKNLASDRLPYDSYVRTLLLQTKTGQITIEEALEKGLERYRDVRKSMLRQRMKDLNMSVALQPYLTILYLNDLADISESRKKKNARWMCRDIVTIYRHRIHHLSQTSYISNLTTLATYPRLLKYLSDKERVQFLNMLCVATQVTTYAHSSHVGMIAKVVMEGVVKYRPDLLVGVMGMKTAADVRRSKRKLCRFINEAALYHDLGKNSIISVVNNDYRPLTDEEVEIIKRRPRMGLVYINISKDMEKYHDTTLGHHKWYNGKGGYPDDFDNTKSPLRIMIDIITFADCMQAATEKVGRNYKEEKTYDALMEEFRQDAGTRYNPDLVEMVDRHENVARKLSLLVNDGWQYIYYQIYKQYFN